MYVTAPRLLARLRAFCRLLRLWWDIPRSKLWKSHGRVSTGQGAEGCNCSEQPKGEGSASASAFGGKSESCHSSHSDSCVLRHSTMAAAASGAHSGSSKTSR